MSLEIDFVHSLCNGLNMKTVRLYDQINDLEIQRDNYLEETRNKQSPAEERERLLKQVKEDNQEIASLERQWVISLQRIACKFSFPKIIQVIFKILVFLKWQFGNTCTYIYGHENENIWILKRHEIYCLIFGAKILNWICRTNELKEKIENIEEEIRQLDLDIEENQGNCSRVERKQWWKHYLKQNYKWKVLNWIV